MISNKVDMYRRLYRGDFGNTVPMWFDVGRWGNEVSLDSKYSSVEWWGIRTLSPGGPCKLNCQHSLVYPVAMEYLNRGYDINISPMIDRIVTVTMWANIVRLNTGLYVNYIEYPSKSSSWREMMSTHSKEVQGTMTNMLLRKHLNPNSLDDLEILLDTYPDAVIELSATESEWGSVPGRNAIVWEVRNY